MPNGNSPTPSSARTPAERKFKLGQRVKLSAEGVRLLTPWSKKLKAHTRGTVTYFFAPLGIRVKVDGYKSGPIQYHMDFWEAVK